MAGPYTQDMTRTYPTPPALRPTCILPCQHHAVMCEVQPDGMVRVTCCACHDYWFERASGSWWRCD